MTDPSSLKNSQRLKFLFKDSFLYGAASSINKAFSLITFPLLARYFSVSDYGIIDLFVVFTSFLTILYVFGQDSAVARYFYEYKDETNRRDLISESFAIQIFFCLLTLPILWWISEWVVSFISNAENAREIFRINLLQIPFLVCINFSRNLLKWTFSRMKFLVISLGSVFLYMLLLLVGVFYLKIEVRGVFIILLLTNIVFGLLGLYYVRHWLHFPRKWVFSGELLKYAIPYGIICCLGSFVPTLERSLVSTLIGSEELGLYAAGAKVAMLVGIVVQSFQTAWGPFSLSIHKEDNAIDTYNWVLKFYTLAICIFVLCLSYAGEYVLSFLASSKYDGASVVVFPLSMALAIQSISWITEIGIGISKRSYLSLYSYSVFVLATGISIYFLASSLGLFGVALGVLIGYSCNALVASYLSFRAYPMNWSHLRVLILVLTSLGTGLLSSHFNDYYLTPLLIISLPIFSWFILFTSLEKQKIVAGFLRFFWKFSLIRGRD
jgi:O-antigen/teichoic acid export membrane protein